MTSNPVAAATKQDRGKDRINAVNRAARMVSARLSDCVELHA